MRQRRRLASVRDGCRVGGSAFDLLRRYAPSRSVCSTYRGEIDSKGRVIRHIGVPMRVPVVSERDDA